MPERYPKRLIEVDLPIKRISAHARREKSLRHGHISTLHIWWARRPLAACRAVICASLWPDPVDELCPSLFVDAAKRLMSFWGKHYLGKCSADSYPRFSKIAQADSSLDDLGELRLALLDFIADFANWDNSTSTEYLVVARTLTTAGHVSQEGCDDWSLPDRLSLGALEELCSRFSRPLVVDPFAGGGSVPIEAIRVGADAFASDLNPVPVLLNRVMLEHVPRYGQRLADEVRRWGDWIKREAEKELAPYYPKDEDKATPIAYIWARTVRCDGPGCGAEIPLVGRAIIGKRKGRLIALSITGHGRNIAVDVVEGEAAKKCKGTCKGFVATCPRPSCGFSTPKKSVQRQLTEQHGGADSARLVAVLTAGAMGRAYRKPTGQDREAFDAAKKEAERLAGQAVQGGLSQIPDESIPAKTAHRAVGSQLPLYGFRTWGELFNGRQKMAIVALQNLARRAYFELANEGDCDFARAVFLLLAFAVDKQADYSSSLCRWVSGGEFITGALAGEKKLTMIADFAESNPVGPGSGSWSNQIDWIVRVIEREATALSQPGSVCQSSADDQILPSDSASAMITDPPYYDSVPYADLSDYYYVWLKRSVQGIEDLAPSVLTPKDREMTVNHPRDLKEKARYETLLTGALENGRAVTMPSGIGVIVFAHKSTAGWETILEAITGSGWVVTASWPIDTERSARLNALATASLGSSVHIVCRPRENPDGRVCTDEVGAWRDVLAELPGRIAAWLPRLASEGVVGADAIFACLGPALEVFSQFSSVEKASGEKVQLREYLECVWAEVAKQALNMIFEGANTSGLEEDSRLTAMWLWTLRTDAETDAAGGDKVERILGYALEYDAARKIAQGLGCHLEALGHLIEVKGETATLLSAASRAHYLFGRADVDVPKKCGKKMSAQGDLFAALELLSDEEISHEQAELERPSAGNTVLDQLHQAMILFGASRGQALKRFLVDDGVGNSPQLWSLAQSLSALYPPQSEEKRWVDGVLARKKGLGF